MRYSSRPSMDSGSPPRYRYLRTVLLGLCCAFLLVVGKRPTATAQQPSVASVVHLKKGPPNRVQVPLLAQRPQLSPGESQRIEEAIARTHRTGQSTTPVGPNATLRLGPPAIPEIKAQNPGRADMNPFGARPATRTLAPSSSGGLAWYVGTNLASGPDRHPTNEPSADFNGRVGFFSYNTYAALTTDWGISWSYIDPASATPQPFQGGALCCDQDVLHDPSRDLTLWSLLYLPDYAHNNPGSTMRLAYTVGEANLAAGTWNATDWTPADISPCSPQSDDWLDYPQLSRSDNYLYITAKMFSRSGAFKCAFLLRISLDQLAAGTALSYDVYAEAGSTETNFQATYGATNTMYFARHANTTTLRVYSWPESSSSVTHSDISHKTYLSVTQGSCTCTTPNGNNPCGWEDDKLLTGYLAKSIAGFLWAVPQGTDGLGTFNYPHVRVLRVSVYNMSVVEDTALYSQSIAYMYPSLHPNSRGDLGGTIASAGNGNYPNCSVMIHDSYNGSSFADTDMYIMQTGTGSPPENRWGDYLRTRVYPAFFDGKAWLGTCYAYQGSSPTITPEIVRFNRPVDSAIWHDRDFVTDGKADLSVWRPSSDTFYWLNSTKDFTDSGLGSEALGTSGDWPFLGDFDGDLEANVAVWRPSNGTFYWITYDRDGSYLNSKQLGVSGDWPLIGDIDGDGLSDLVVWRPSNGTFYWLGSFTNYAVLSSHIKQWGGSGDWPLLADVDGDRKADLCVWRGSDGTFRCLLSSMSYDSAYALVKQFGGSVNGDWPLIGDVDGDGKADLCVWDTWSGYGFACLLSMANYSTEFAYSKQWGNAGDWPYLADMDGDGKADLIVYHPGNSTFFWLTSSSGYNTNAYRAKSFGTAGDFVPSVNYPIPTATGLNPASVKAGGSTFTLTVNGMNFVNGAVIRWNGSLRSTAFISATAVSTQIGATDIATTGSANITVFNPAPGGGETAPLTFTIGKTPTILALVSSKLNASPSEPITFVAFLTLNPYRPARQSDAVTPTGTITFTIDSKTSIPVPVNPDGSAAYTTSTLSKGTHIVIAQYSGDANLAGGTSNELQIVIGKFTINLPIVKK